MTVVVTSQGPDLSRVIYVWFDLANYFVVLDTDSGDFTAYDNSQNRGGSQDAEFQAAKMVADMGVEAVVSWVKDKQSSRYSAQPVFDRAAVPTAVRCHGGAPHWERLRDAGKIMFAGSPKTGYWQLVAG